MWKCPGLSNLAARDQVGATAHPPHAALVPWGDRLTDLAQRAGMTKIHGAAGRPVRGLGLVTRRPDPHDARARRVLFTPTGLAWLQGFRDAVTQAEAEFRAEVGNDVATVVAIGLGGLCGGGDRPMPPTNPITPTNRHTGQHSPCPRSGRGPASRPPPTQPCPCTQPSH